MPSPEFVDIINLVILIKLPRIPRTKDMHELGITQEVLNLALAEAKAAKARRISRINLVVGEASGVVDDSVQFCFELLSGEGIARGAALSFKRIPIRMRCRQCGHSFSPNGLYSSCPACQKWDAEVTAGKEFYIDSIEVD